MNRRTMLTSLAASPFAARLRAAAKPPIQLHTDLHVLNGHAEKLVSDFHARYLPLIRKAPGFLDAKLLDLRAAHVGKPDSHYNGRLIQVFETEEQRESWRKTEPHKVAWHEAIESHLKVPFIAFVYDVLAEAKPLAAAFASPNDPKPVHLHDDFEVPPANEKKLLDNFRKILLPQISKAPGFLNAQLLKFRQANVGERPARYNYRLIQVFASEQHREQWTYSEPHKDAWPAIERPIKLPFTAVLYAVSAQAKRA